MGSYFKPWRRKIGVVTLLMACVFAGRWFRSFRMDDKFTWLNNSTAFRIHSTNYGVFLTSSERFNNEIDGLPGWSSFPLPRLRLGIHSYAPGETHLFCVKYSTLIIPLALLSAWLLLGKTRKSTQRKPTELIPEMAS